MQQTSTTLFALLMCMMMVIIVTGHKCIHSTVSPDASRIARVVQEAPIPSTDASRRSMKAQEEDVWDPLEMMFEYNYTDPAKDVAADGTPRSCVAVGDKIPIGGSSASSLDCMTSQRTTDCTYTCIEEDILTPETLASLQGTINLVKAKFEALLKIRSTAALSNPPRVTVESTDGACGELVIPKQNVTGSNHVMYVVTRPIRYLGDTIAFALPCAVDFSTERPILGLLNVAPGTITTNSDLATVIFHEITHALGFSPSLMPYYRHPTSPNQSYFDFDSTKYPTGILSGDGIVDKGAGSFSVDFRGLGPGKKMKLIGPNLLAYAREYYGCENLDGVEMENGGNSPGSTASHWEKRTMFTEYMTATQNLLQGVVSGFTLALFTDMGYYRSAMELADTMSWGAKKGCSFVNGDCSAWGSDYFCAARATSGACNFNRQAMGQCNIGTFNADLPEPYQHFPGEPRLGGDDEMPDYCPFVRPYQDGICADGTQTSANAALFFESRGTSDRCFTGNIISDQFQPPSTLQARCHKVVCVPKIPTWSTPKPSYVPMMEVNGKWLKCPDGAVIGAQIPPRANVQPYVFHGNESAVYRSYGTSGGMVGLMDCGIGLEALCDQTSTPLPGTNPGVPSGQVYNSALWSYDDWPAVTSLSPTGVVQSGGSTVTIHGFHLQFCPKVKVGGKLTTNLRYEMENVTFGTIFAQTAEFTPGEVGYGGPWSDGTGPVDIEISCSLPLHCAAGSECAMLTLPSAIEIAVTTPQPPGGPQTPQPAGSTPNPNGTPIPQGQQGTTPAPAGSGTPPNGSGTPQTTAAGPPPTTSSPGGSPAPGSTPAPTQTATTPSPAALNNSVIFTIKPPQTPDGLRTAIANKFGIAESALKVAGPAQQLTNGDIEVEFGFPTELLMDAALAFSDSEKTAMGIESSRRATPPASDDDGDDKIFGILPKYEFLGSILSMLLFAAIIMIIKAICCKKKDKNKDDDQFRRPMEMGLIPEGGGMHSGAIHGHHTAQYPGHYPGQYNPMQQTPYSPQQHGRMDYNL